MLRYVADFLLTDAPIKEIVDKIDNGIKFNYNYSSIRLTQNIFLFSFWEKICVSIKIEMKIRWTVLEKFKTKHQHNFHLRTKSQPMEIKKGFTYSLYSIVLYSQHKINLLIYFLVSKLFDLENKFIVLQKWETFTRPIYRVPT